MRLSKNQTENVNNWKINIFVQLKNFIYSIFAVNLRFNGVDKLRNCSPTEMVFGVCGLELNV